MKVEKGKRKKKLNTWRTASALNYTESMKQHMAVLRHGEQCLHYYIEGMKQNIAILSYSEQCLH